MTNFHLAPPPRVVDGLTAVPVDFSRVEATIEFDVGAATASVDATAHFELGAAAGSPIFDLRQAIASAWLDGTPIAPALLAHHDFGGGPDAGLRVIGVPLAAHSSHQLRLQYELGQPDAPGTKPIGWDGSRLSFDFWFSDLAPGRYLEMWLPANLLFDQFELEFELRVLGTTVDHVVITNGEVTDLGPGHWDIAFPAWWNAACPMLLVEASDRVESRTGSVTPPSGAPITLETWRDLSVGTSLGAVETALAGHILDNISNVGPYLHDGRFTAYLWSSSRAMEYAGATTTTAWALEHETFHSWYARGVLPAAHPDGWLDEAYTTWSTSGPLQADPLGLSLSVSTLSQRNPYARETPAASYSRGKRVFSGMAHELGIPGLLAAMGDVYDVYGGQPFTTERFEEELVARTGETRIVDLFQRYVYGLVDSTASGGPDLYIRDASDDPGFDQYTGSRFWDSPDLWIRNDPDGGTTHQSPEYGQDNWFHARVRNRGATTARHFLVTFNPTQFAGTQFVYPSDWLPPVAASAQFELDPGDTRVTTSHWPEAAVPAGGTHVCLLASVYTTSDPPINGRRVWQHNNLAQKNLNVVDLVPNDTYAFELQLGSIHSREPSEHLLEVLRPSRYPHVGAVITHRDPSVIERLLEPVPIETEPRPAIAPSGPVWFEGATRIAVAGAVFDLAPQSGIRLVEPGPVRNRRWTAPMVTSATFIRLGPNRAGARLPPGRSSLLRLRLGARQTLRPRLEIRVPSDARPGEILEFDVLQRTRDGTVVGGVSLHVNVQEPQRS